MAKKATRIQAQPYKIDEEEIEEIIDNEKEEEEAQEEKEQKPKANPQAQPEQKLISFEELKAELKKDIYLEIASSLINAARK